MGTCTANSLGCQTLNLISQLQNVDTTVNTHGRELLRLCEGTALVLCTGRTPLDVPAQPSFKARSNTAGLLALTTSLWTLTFSTPFSLVHLDLHGQSLTTFH